MPRPPLQPATAPPQDGSSNTGVLRSTLEYFTDPVTYTVSGIVRRLSEDQAPTALARALSANYNGSLSEQKTEMFHAPKRHLSPFQPPPLTPLTLQGLGEDVQRKAQLLRTALAEEIRLLIPPRLQLADHWRLVYSLERNGSTLSSLYSLCDMFSGKRGGFVLVVKDAGNGVFGAYLTDAPKPHPQYYGSGECFLWRAIKVSAMPLLANLPPPPSADTTNLGRMTTISGSGSNSATVSRTNSSTSLSSNAAISTTGIRNGDGLHRSAVTNDSHKSHYTLRFKAFPYTGANDFSILCDPQYLSVGGGDGHYGLWLNDTLSKGVSAPCPTFANESLSEEGVNFDVLGVEIWYIGS